MTPQPPSPAGNRRIFWPAALIGWGLIGVGVAGVLGNTRDTHPLGFGRLFAGLLLIHDGLFAPLVLGFGLVAGRLVPRRARAVVQGSLIASGLVVLFSWPFLRDYGSRGTNKSALPLDYGRGVLILLAVIWGTGAVLAIRRLLARRGAS